MIKTKLLSFILISFLSRQALANCPDFTGKYQDGWSQEPNKFITIEQTTCSNINRKLFQIDGAGNALLLKEFNVIIDDKTAGFDIHGRLWQSGYGNVECVDPFTGKNCKFDDMVFQYLDQNSNLISEWPLTYEGGGKDSMKIIYSKLAQ